MNSPPLPNSHRGVASLALIAFVLASGALLAAWKHNAQRAQTAGSANQPEPVEVVAVASAQQREHQPTTTAIGTARALRSITLRNELPGTVRYSSLSPGKVVAPGTVLVALDVSVEQAELRALEAEAVLAETTFKRRTVLRESGTIAQDALDQARAQRDGARAQVERLRAVIAKKTIRAPFRVRVGLADVHPGQYLNQGVELTTLQGVDGEVFIDFAVAQRVAAGMRVGMPVEISTGEGAPTMTARVVAVDARVDPTTRNATIRARLASSESGPAPGASVRVRVPVGSAGTAVAIPVSALRKGPEGDHVWVVTPDGAGKARAQKRMVESGPALGEVVIVLSGLRAGEQVAAAGSFKLRDGIQVKPATTLAASP